MLAKSIDDAARGSCEGDESAHRRTRTRAQHKSFAKKFIAGMLRRLNEKKKVESKQVQMLARTAGESKSPETTEKIQDWLSRLKDNVVYPKLLPAAFAEMHAVVNADGKIETT